MHGSVVDWSLLIAEISKVKKFVCRVSVSFSWSNLEFLYVLGAQ